MLSFRQTFSIRISFLVIALGGPPAPGTAAVVVVVVVVVVVNDGAMIVCTFVKFCFLLWLLCDVSTRYDLMKCQEICRLLYTLVTFRFRIIQYSDQNQIDETTRHPTIIQKKKQRIGIPRILSVC